MKLLIVVSALVALAVGQDTYTLEKHDFDAAFSNPETLKTWINCFLGHGPCAPIQSQSKGYLADAIPQACAKCSAEQKVLSKKFLEAFKQQSPDEYETFRKKVDPENKYLGPFFKAIA